VSILHNLGLQEMHRLSGRSMQATTSFQVLFANCSAAMELHDSRASSRWSSTAREALSSVGPSSIRYASQLLLFFALFWKLEVHLVSVKAMFGAVSSQ
jgi:hypothetical protein